MSGKVVASGRFRVDRKRALDKIERFQLEDPRRYVLELLAAACCAGAEKVEIYNDSDDFILSFDMAPLTGAELDGVFDHVFGKARTTREQVRQHLGIAVLGALGLKPKWVHLDSGDDEVSLRVTVNDPAETRHVPLSEPVAGVRVHVRERMTLHRMREALRLMLAEPDEAQLVRGAAAWYPVPLVINGTAVAPRELPEPAILQRSSFSQRNAHLVVMPDIGETWVDLVRHGVIVGRRAWTVGRWRVAGWIDVSDLRLNASRAKLVEDAAYGEAVEQMEGMVDELLIAGLGAVDELEQGEPLQWSVDGAGRYRATRAELIDALGRAAVPYLVRRGTELGPWEDVAFLEDLLGHRWTVRELREETDIPGISSVVPPPKGWNRAVFQPTWNTLLETVFGEVPDLTEEVTVAAGGQARRREAAASRRPPTFRSGAAGRTFARESVRGAVRRGEHRGRTISVRLQVDGMVVQTREVPSRAGGLEAVVDHPDFATDLGFRQVLEDRVFAAAMEVLEFQAMELARAELRDGTWDASRWRDRTGWLTELLGAAPDVSRHALATGQSGPWCETPGLLRGDGEWITPRALAAADHPWFVVSSLPDQTEGVDLRDLVVMAPWMQRIWRRWMGPGFELADEIMEARRRRAARMITGRQEARVSGCVHVLAVEHEGWGGEVGFDPAASDTVVRVLREGVLVCDLAVDRTLPGGRGVVDVGPVGVDDAHEALLEPRPIVGGLRRELDRVALLRWAAVAEGEDMPPEIMRWLVRRGGVKGLPAEALQRTIVARVGGEVLTVADAIAMGARKRGPKLVMLSERTFMPGFEDAVVERPHLGPLLEMLTKGRVRSGERDVRQAKAHAVQYREREVWSPPPALAQLPVKGDGWEGTAYLPASPKQIGQLQVLALFDGRLLARRETRGSPGAMLVVHGPALRPNRRYVDVVEPKVLTRLKRDADEVLGELVRLALQGPPSESLLALAGQMGKAPKGRWAELRRTIEDRPLLWHARGTPISPAEVIDARERGERLYVVSKVEAGATDGIYLRDSSLVRRWLKRRLGVDPEKGDDRLAGFRASSERRRVETRREPRIHGTPLASCIEEEQGTTLAIGVYLHGEPGMRITPLVDGLELGVITLSAPSKVVVEVAGPDLSADARFEKVAPNKAWKAVLQRIERGLHTLYDEALEAAYQAPPWALSAVLRFGKLADRPILALADGSMISLEEARRRQEQDGAVAAVSSPLRHDAERLRPPPLVLDHAQHALLREDLQVISVDPALSRSHEQLVGRAWGLESPRRGRLSVYDGGDRITVEHDGVVWAVWSRERGDHHALLPLRGWVVDDELEPDALLRGPKDPRAAVALRQAIERQGEAIVRDLLAERERRPRLDAHLRQAMGWLVKQGGLKALRAHALGQALMSTPAFTECGGSCFTLAELVAQDRWFAVPPTSASRPLERGVTPILSVDDATRSWLERVLQLKSGAELLRTQLLGQERRRVAPRSRQLPAVAGTMYLVHRWEDRTLQIWLAPPRHGQGLEIRVDHRLVQHVDIGVPGLQGWVDGSFTTDDAFETATLADTDQQRIDAAVVSLLTREWAESPRRARKRLLEALPERGLDALIKRAPLWGELTTISFARSEEEPRPRSMRELVDLTRKNKQILVDPAGLGEVVPRPRLCVPDVEYAQALLPKIRPEMLSTWRRDEHERAEAARERVAGVRTRRLHRAVLTVARELGASKGPLLTAAVADAVAAVEGDELEEPVLSLLGWSAVLCWAATSGASIDPVTLALQVAQRVDTTDT